MAAFVHWLKGHLEEYLALPGDTEVETGRKHRGVILGTLALLICMTWPSAVPHESVWKYVGLAIVGVTAVLLLSYVICTKTAPAVLLETVTYMWTCGLLCSVYIGSATGLPSQWQFVVILLDISLVNQLSSRTAIVTIMLTCTALCALQVLFAMDLQLPDRIHLEHICDCADPPCRASTGGMFMLLLQDIGVLLVDFYLTRGFAQGVLEEKASMQAAVDTAERVSVCLGGFDLDAADLLLEGEAGRLPEGLTQALQTLLQNLRLYKPYLPKSCLPVDAFAPANSPDTPPDAAAVNRLGSEPSIPTIKHTISVLSLPEQFVAELCVKRCTAVTLNLHDTLESLDTHPELFTGALSYVLQKTLMHVEACRGMVDLFVGDKIAASFNASRQCVQHATSAVQALTMVVFGEAGLNCGIATGRAHCGDLGCADMRRFSVVGKLPLLSAALERAGRVLDLIVVCNSVAQSDARLEHELRLIPRMLALQKLGSNLSDPPLPMYEVAGPPQQQRQNTSSTHEWMYSMEDESDIWAEYDTAVRRFLQGDNIDEVRRRVGDPSVLPALDKAMNQIASRQPLKVFF